MTSDGSVLLGSAVKVKDMSGAVLALGIVHLTYFTDNQGRRVWQRWLWRLTETSRRVYFQQGTLTA